MMEQRVIDSYDNVKIVEVRGDPLPMYLIEEPEFSEYEKGVMQQPQKMIENYDAINKKLNDLKTPNEKIVFLTEYLTSQFQKNGIKSKDIGVFVSALIDHVFLRYGRLGPLIRDDRLEEIMFDSLDTPVFVVHRKHGMCITSVEYKDESEFEPFIRMVSEHAGRKINAENPLLDAHMPDGSRINITVPPASPEGASITIRKFKKTPYNIIELIKIRTVSMDLAAFLWVCVEGLGICPANILIAGGAGSGKTTFLNAICMFIPNNERVVSVEDTLEINLEFVENWVPLEAAPLALEGGEKLSMHRLLQNSLRMRPDRVIVGEVRGKEAETFLVAMDIGLKGSMCTLHANNAREATIRLTSEPMAVPIRMLPLIDLVIVLNRHYDRVRGMSRRVTQVAELSGIEKETIQMGDIYLWNVKTDDIRQTEYPIMFKEEIAKKCGLTKKELDIELLLRKKVLEYMIKNNITQNEDVIRMFQRYHSDKAGALSQVGIQKRTPVA